MYVDCGRFVRRMPACAHIDECPAMARARSLGQGACPGAALNLRQLLSGSKDRFGPSLCENLSWSTQGRKSTSQIGPGRVFF